MSTDGEASSGNGEDMFPSDEVAEPTLEPPKVRSPSPWHKPRKQWIRKLQWGKLVCDLITELQFDGRPFRYLTLPGRYFLDVRHLHSICAERNIQLRFVGFDTDRRHEPEASISADEVWRLSHIHKESDILGDAVETLSQSKSIAFERIAKFGDFDAVNLDLCDSVASREAGANDSALAAILRVIALQSSRRAAPWLLFLTTRADRLAVKPSVMKKLLEVLAKNMQRNAKFKTEATRHAVICETKLASEANGEAAMDDLEFMGAFGIGFSKWLLNMSLTAWKVHQQIGACYRVFPESASPDMLSLAFRFERQPTAISDTTGIVPATRVQNQQRNDSEDELAARFIDGHRSNIDIDELLLEDAYLREEMIIENADLMSLARFDREMMIEWGRANCWDPSRQQSAQETTS